MNVAFGVSSVGLGHARRSLTLAKYLRKERKDLEITWFAAEPVITFLEKEGETVPPVCHQLRSLSSVMEAGVSSGRLRDISKVARSSSSIARQNYFLLKSELVNCKALIQDEFIETLLAFMWEKNPSLPQHRVLITDYLELQSSGTLNPLSRLVSWYANRMLWKGYAACAPRIFADDLDLIPASLKVKAQKVFSVVGPILPDPPAESKSALKEKILTDHFGVCADHMKLLVIAVGGTDIGKYLISFFVQNQTELSEKLNCNILVLLGPRIDGTIFGEVKGICLRLLPFSPSVMGYFKAADCVICQAGASTLNEVLAVGTPCVTIPISNHFEQEANAMRFSEKYGFARLSYADVNVHAIVRAVEKATSTEPLPVNFSANVTKAGDLILQTLQS